MTTLRLLCMLMLCVFMVTCFGVEQADGQTLKIDSELKDAFSDLPTPADPGEPVLLRYQFEDGDQITWKMRIESELDVMGMVMPKVDQYTVVSKYRRTDGGFQVVSKMKDLLSEMRTRGGSLIIDTQNPDREMADPPFAPFVKIWKVVRESELNCDFTNLGVVDEIKVPDAVEQVVANEGKGYGITAMDTMASLLIGIMQLPEKPVSPGDQWDIKVLVPPMNSDVVSQTGTFLGTADVDGRQVALIQLEFEASTEDGKGMVSDFESTSRALVLFDVKAGKFYRSYTVLEAEAVMNMGDREVMQLTSGTSTTEQLKD